MYILEKDIEAKREGKPYTIHAEPIKGSVKFDPSVDIKFAIIKDGKMVESEILKYEARSIFVKPFITKPEEA